MFLSVRRFAIAVILFGLPQVDWITTKFWAGVCYSGGVLFLLGTAGSLFAWTLHAEENKAAGGWVSAKSLHRFLLERSRWGWRLRGEGLQRDQIAFRTAQLLDAKARDGALRTKRRGNGEYVDIDPTYWIDYGLEPLALLNPQESEVGTEPKKWIGTPVRFLNVMFHPADVRREFPAADVFYRALQEVRRALRRGPPSPPMPESEHFVVLSQVIGAAWERMRTIPALTAAAHSVGYATLLEYYEADPSKVPGIAAHILVNDADPPIALRGVQAGRVVEDRVNPDGYLFSDDASALYDTLDRLKPMTERKRYEGIRASSADVERRLKQLGV